MSKPSKYGPILAGRQNPPAEVEPEPIEPPAAPETPAPFVLGSNSDPKAIEDPPPPALPRAASRPKGKRSDRSFSQRTAYLPLRLHHDVDVALKADNLASAEQGRPSKDFSELVAELLSAWLAGRIAK